MLKHKQFLKSLTKFLSIPITKKVSTLFTEKYTINHVHLSFPFQSPPISTLNLKTHDFSFMYTSFLSTKIRTKSTIVQTINDSTKGGYSGWQLLPHSIHFKFNNFVPKTDLANNMCPYVKLDFQNFNRRYCFYSLLA